MKYTFNGYEIYSGMIVVLLQTPVIGQHEFKKGKVVNIADKTVLVEYEGQTHHWSSKEEKKIVKRYPEQLIYVKSSGEK